MTERSEEETQSAVRPQETAIQDDSFRFHEEWSLHDQMMTALMVGSLKSAFPGYEIPEGLEIKENRNKGRYHRRSSDNTEGEVPLIEVHPERRFESLGHELGHDVHYQFIDHIHDNKVVRSSFKEAFADLLMFYAVPVDPEDRSVDRDISEYDTEFETLRQILDPEKRRNELENIRETGQALFQGDEEEVNASAWNLVQIPPQYGKNLAVGQFSDRSARAEEYEFKLIEDSIHSRDNMFIANFQPGKVTFDDIAQMKTDIWRLSEVIKHSDSYPWKDPVKEALNQESRIGEKLRFTAKDREEHREEYLTERPFDVVETALEEEIDLAYCMIDNYVESLQQVDDIPGEVLEGLENVKYGNSYSESVDFPHNVGGSYAEKLYRENVTPYELLIEKDEHVRALEDRLRTEIDQRIPETYPLKQ